MTVRVHAGEIDAVALSGDFTLLPPDALAHIEAAARGPLEELGERVEAVYRERRVEAPGLGPGELSGALTAVVAGQT
jgi:hypothetical protein